MRWKKIVWDCLHRFHPLNMRRLSAKRVEQSGTATGLVWCAAGALSTGMLRLCARRSVDGLRPSVRADRACVEDVCPAATWEEHDVVWQAE